VLFFEFLVFGEDRPRMYWAGQFHQFKFFGIGAIRFLKSHLGVEEKETMCKEAGFRLKNFQFLLFDNHK